MVLLFCLASEAWALEPIVLTEYEACDLLKSKSLRWKQVAEGVNEADGKLQQAQSLTLPHFAFGIDEFVGRINLLQYGFPDPGNLDVFTFGATSLQFGYDVWNPAIGSLTVAARKNADAARSTLDANQNDLMYYMLALYTQVQRWESIVRNRKENIQTIEKLKELAERKLKSEVGIRLDVRRAEARLALGQMKLFDAENNLEKARSDLASILGIETIDRPLTAIETTLSLPFDQNQLKPEEVLESRPDYQAAKKTSLAADLMVEHHEKERLPRLLIAGELGVAGVTAFDGFAHGLTGTAGVFFTLPLYTGGLTDGKVAEARANAARAEEQKDQIALDARHQLESTLYQYRLANQALDTAKNGAAVAKDELDLANRRFASGTGGNFEVINAQMSLAQILDDVTDAWFAHRQATYLLLKQTNKIEKYIDSIKGH